MTYFSAGLCQNLVPQKKKKKKNEIMKLNKKFNVQINITDLWGKYEKICVKIYV